PPNLSLIVSGGHTMLVRVNAVADYEILGSTKDDAAGEAFDKVGKMLGLPYPGGPIIDQRATKGNPKAFDFPRSMLGSGDYHFSFSGLKTSMANQLGKLGEAAEDATTIDDLCASFQAAVVDVLVKKTIKAAKEFGISKITVSGGVSCNSGLREQMSDACQRRNLDLHLATPSYSTDNAAMIAYAAACRIHAGIGQSDLNTDINPNLKLV
ncbi:MAG: tRNA (adenosine(37)-N6)-threonylcarbamoyltransferase complex transferase subunit TsaD, partial [Verrucomicrobiota bacterium]